MDLLGKLKKQLHTHNPSQWKREALWLLDSMKQHAPSILMVALLGFAGTAMGLLSSVASKYLIDAVTGFGSTLLLRSAAALVIFTLGSLMLQALSSRVGARVHIRVKNSLQQKTYGKILRSGWEALEPFRSGDLLNRLTADVSTVSEGIINFLPGLLSSGVKFAGAFGIMLFYDPVMALIALLGVPVTLVLSRALLGQLRRHNLQMKDLTGEVLSFQEDSFRNLTSIKSFSITDRFEEEMGRLQSRYADAYLSFNAFQIKTSSAMAVLSMLVSMCCFGWGVYQLWAGNITYGSMTMFLQLAGTLRGAFSSLVSLGQQAISLTTSAGRIMTVEDLPEEEMTVPEGLLREERLDICLRNVSFEYQNAETVLRSFDFDASHGDSIALTGPSGEGKTTLLRLLLGLVQSCSGTMELVGGSGRRYPIHPGTRPAFAYVPQGNSVFAGTIAQNLRLAAPDATAEQMQEALKIACAWDFVNQFPDGLDHTLGAGGRGISEGQAQRLAIARALLRRAPILLLDEATSGLDPATEQALLNNLRECGFVSTCILVTHRSASAAFCGRAYEISQGTVTKLEK